MPKPEKSPKKFPLRDKKKRAEALRKLHEEMQKRVESRALKETQDEPLPVMRAGMEMNDKSIYAGQLPNFRPFYAAPQDESGVMRFNQVAAHITKVNKESYLGHDDWRLPTPEEIEILYQEKNAGAFARTFHDQDNSPKSWYWTSDSTDGEKACDYRFSDGVKGHHDNFSAVRLVRGGAPC